MLLLLLLLPLALSAPPRVLYDQRQEGEWNILADLKNVVVMVVPSQGTSSNLMDFILKAAPQKTDTSPAHFIESKTAPYSVDISKSAVHPMVKTEEESSTDALKRLLEKTRPSVLKLKERFLTPQSGVEEAAPDPEEHSGVLLGEGLEGVPVVHGEEVVVAKSPPVKLKRSTEKVLTELKLLGAEYEQCGPGLVRDREGICRTVKA